MPDAFCIKERNKQYPNQQVYKCRYKYDKYDHKKILSAKREHQPEFCCRSIDVQEEKNCLNSEHTVPPIKAIGFTHWVLHIFHPHLIIN